MLSLFNYFKHIKNGQNKNQKITRSKYIINFNKFIKKETHN